MLVSKTTAPSSGPLSYTYILVHSTEGISLACTFRSNDSSRVYSWDTSLSLFDFLKLFQLENCLFIKITSLTLSECASIS